MYLVKIIMFVNLILGKDYYCTGLLFNEKVMWSIWNIAGRYEAFLIIWFLIKLFSLKNKSSYLGISYFLFIKDVLICPVISPSKCIANKFGFIKVSHIVARFNKVDAYKPL